ncbi:MAG: hypothetical protein FWE23_09760 [Chitinivibrionia bacterium]|nr:hypothetical protein [Chitinivibrionia bacterium]
MRKGLNEPATINWTIRNTKDAMRHLGITRLATATTPYETLKNTKATLDFLRQAQQ